MTHDASCRRGTAPIKKQQGKKAKRPAKKPRKRKAPESELDLSEGSETELSDHVSMADVASDSDEVSPAYSQHRTKEQCRIATIQ